MYRVFLASVLLSSLFEFNYIVFSSPEPEPLHFYESFFFVDTTIDTELESVSDMMREAVTDSDGAEFIVPYIRDRDHLESYVPVNAIFDPVRTISVRMPELGETTINPIVANPLLNVFLLRLLNCLTAP